MKELKEFADRIIGFSPEGAVIWSAIGATILAALFQWGTTRYKKKVELPWMREENQKNKEQMINNFKKSTREEIEK
ncbi:hypothetical protein RYX45_00505 [Alkalihalophilus pseudofirmus]|uniref:Phage protein n=1 Tax=Alkalihalophilus pseudofirmus TaxID=79885 RepID=A0AAJ2NMI5_ALKPS|nr:hypothetical protein [Alkalihalophilus pseudofirmus]MDV2883640.1 hypothetical protein [Alkalihalophilus pseudofirmus]WEG17769.1 hypothetical protein PQ478_04575 [Alkalihalophilus pseudofirmus]